MVGFENEQHVLDIPVKPVYQHGILNRLQPECSLRFARVAMVLCCLAWLTASQGNAQDTPEKVFLHETSVSVETAPLQAASSSAQSRLVRLNRSAGARLAASLATRPLRLILNLTGNEEYEAVFERRKLLQPGRVLCIGRVEGRPGSYVTLALSGEAVAGSVFIPGRGMFQIQYAGNGTQRIVETDGNHLPSCGRKPRALSIADSFVTESLMIQAASAPAAPTNTIIDLLVVYTAAARNGAGGTNGMNALIDAAVAEANLAFENSEVNAELRLVHRVEANYSETGNINEDLDRLEDPDEDSPLSIVHQLRGEHRADLVCMITETTGGPFGLANQMRESDVEFGVKAFSIVQRQHAISYQALAHELGHNMGCQHDRETSPGGGIYDYSHAYRFEVDGVLYHTVMAYQPGLPIPYFSNPDVLFLGVPTGIAEPSTNSANNAKTLKRTVSTVARFDSTVRVGRPPQVSLLTPTNGAVFTVPAAIEVTARASDPDGTVVKVEFYINGTKVNTLTEPPFAMLWTNSTPGTYSFRAETQDNTGWEVFSPRAFVTLVLPPPVIDASASHPLANGAFQLRVRGVDGQAFRLEASEDLVGWNFLMTDSLIGEIFDYPDDTATNFTKRFYRALPVP